MNAAHECWSVRYVYMLAEQNHDECTGSCMVDIIKIVFFFTQQVNSTSEAQCMGFKYEWHKHVGFSMRDLLTCNLLIRWHIAFSPKACINVKTARPSTKLISADFTHIQSKLSFEVVWHSRQNVFSTTFYRSDLIDSFRWLKTVKRCDSNQSGMKILGIKLWRCLNLLQVLIQTWCFAY